MRIGARSGSNGSAERAASPAVSVVLPTHNRPRWLRASLGSVLEGGFRDFEVIVSNNGRPEHTRELAQEIDDPRVRWIEQPPSGMLEHFRAALSLARGRYVAALYDDDWWHESFLATLVPPLEDGPQLVAAFADQTQVHADGELDIRATEYYSRTSGRATLAAGTHRPFDHLAVRETVPIAGCVFRREAVSPAAIPLDVGAAYDVWIAYLLARTGGGAHYCPDRLAFLREHESSDFATEPIPNLVAAANCQRRMLRDPRLAPYREELGRRLAAREQGIGAALLRRGQRSDAREHLGAALRLRRTAKGGAAWAATWLVPGPLLARL
jgi:glycosyltransferase involved in cell wall biosynthesis